MPRYVAFLRAINVGGHTVKMEALRKLFEGWGFANVATFIASGNVLFDAEQDATPLEVQIAGELQRALGYEVATFIRTPDELAGIAAHQPFPGRDEPVQGSTLMVAFLPRPLEAAAWEKVLAWSSAVDEFHLHGREIYWLVRIRSSDSEFSGAALEKAIRMPATLRNITTVRKLAALS